MVMSMSLKQGQRTEIRSVTENVSRNVWQCSVKLRKSSTEVNGMDAGDDYALKSKMVLPTLLKRSVE